MQSNRFVRYHRHAEAAGYPVLLIVSMLCLALIVAPILLLGLTKAGWVLALALLSLVVAVAVMTGAVEVTLSDNDEPAAGRTDLGTETPDQREPAAPLSRPEPTTQQAARGRKAA